MSDAIDSHRRHIDRIDDELVRLLNERYREVHAIGEWKRAHQLPVFVPERERVLLARLAELNRGGVMPEKTLYAVWREIMSGARALEAAPVVAFLGPCGTFSHQAVIERFGHAVELQPVNSIADVFRSIETERAEYGCVPVENTTEGAVSYTLDMLMYSPTTINAELNLKIHHHLLAACPAGEIRTIYSHPQVLGQCRNYLLQHYPAAELAETASTTRAAELAREDAHGAAIAGAIAAELSDLRILAENIEDSGGNTTRFLILGQQATQPSGRDKTSLCIGLVDRPGALYQALAPFEEAGITLSMIESRPLKNANFEYAFFIDLVGHRQDAKVAAACERLRSRCSFFRVLGSYPCA